MLADALRENPKIDCRVLLIDRFSGPTVAAMSHVTGVSNDVPLVDPAIAHFERECTRSGLSFTKKRPSEALLDRIGEGQTYFQRAQWFLAGHYDNMVFYSIQKSAGEAHSASDGISISK